MKCGVFFSFLTFHLSFFKKMVRQLFVDCLNEIFEHLENENETLRSCLLVNRLWCEVTVRILWRNVWNFELKIHQQSSIISTLFACFPHESKELLLKNEIIISTPTSKQPLFNYETFYSR